MHTTTIAFALFLAGAASAQTSAFVALAPANAQATVGLQTQTTPLNQGVLAVPGTFGATLTTPAGHAQASVAWSVTSLGYWFELALEQFAYTQAIGTGPVSASVNGGDFLLLLSNPTPVAIGLELSRSLGNTIGNVTQSVQIDVGADGSVEFTESSPGPSLTIQVTIGPVPLLVRIQDQLQLTGSGSVDSTFRIRAIPTAGITTIQAILGCDPGHSQTLMPTFGGNLEMFVVGPLFATHPAVTVIGLSVQPLILPSSLPFPCLLLPSPDLVVFSPGQGFTLPLPAAVRPVTFWTQAVVLDPAGLQTTNGHQVSAY